MTTTRAGKCRMSVGQLGTFRHALRPGPRTSFACARMTLSPGRPLNVKNPAAGVTSCDAVAPTAGSCAATATWRDAGARAPRTTRERTLQLLVNLRIHLPASTVSSGHRCARYPLRSARHKSWSGRKFQRGRITKLPSDTSLTVGCPSQLMRSRARVVDQRGRTLTT